MSTSEKLSFYEYDKQIAAAFKIDCEDFLEEFEKLKSLRFSDFVKVWQLKNFTYVFSGQKFALLLKELCENCFYIVRKFMVLHRSVFTQIGAFYMLYGLYYKQPLKTWVKIRLTLDEYIKLTELIESMKRQGQYEAVYIFAKMKVDQAFVYTALSKPLGPEERFVKSYETYLDYAFNASKKEETIENFNELVRDGDLIKDIEKTNNEYQELMRKYVAKCSSLTPFTSTIVRDLQEACIGMESEEVSTKEEQNTEVPVEDKRSNKKRSVKQKAMANKNAVYRGNRKVKMAVDLDFDDDSTDDDIT